MAKSISEYTIHLIHCALHNQIPEHWEGDWHKLFKFAKFHKITNMLYYSICKLEANEVPQEVLESFKKQHIQSVAKEATQHLSLEEVRNKFKLEGIDFLRLKGCVLKEIYPTVDMRDMCDLDILYRTKDRELVSKALEELGYNLEHDTGYHISFFRLPFMNIEMHCELVGNSSPYYVYFKDVWNTVREKGTGEFEYQFTPEYFYVYHLAHMAKHYIYSGFGLRPLIDCYMIEKNFVLDKDILERELKKVGLLAFYELNKSLSLKLFSEKVQEEIELTEYERQLYHYIITSGNDGTHKNATCHKMLQPQSKNIKVVKWRYLLTRLFPNAQELSSRFTVLKKAPYLLPLFWCIRFMAIPFRDKKGVHIFMDLTRFEEKDINKQDQLNNKLGLFDLHI